MDNKLSDRAALIAIQVVLDGKEWSAASLDAIAAIVRKNGLEIRDINEGEPA